MNYRNYSQNEDPPDSPHAIWRGIGCIMMIIIPIFAYALSVTLMPILKKNGLFLPVELGRDIVVAGILIPDLYAVLALTILLTLILYAFLAVVNALIFDIAKAQGKTLRSLDAPPKYFTPKSKRRDRK